MDWPEVMEPCCLISKEEVAAAIKGLKMGKSAIPTGVVSEMMKASGGFGSKWMTNLTNNIVKEGCIPNDWRKSILVPVYKGKGQSSEARSGLSSELLYSDDLVLMVPTMEQLGRRVAEWRASLLDKGLKMNAGKSKVMVGSSGGKMIVNSGKWPCGVCGKGAQANSVVCTVCKKNGITSNAVVCVVTCRG